MNHDSWLTMSGKVSQGAFIAFVYQAGRLMPVLLLCIASLSSAHEVLVLKSADIKPHQQALDGFHKTCGCNTSGVVVRDLRDDDLAKKIASLKINAIFAIGSEALRAAQSISSIPIVYAFAHFSPDSRRDQAGISGVILNTSARKQLDAIVRVFPKVRRIGCIYDENNSGDFVKDALQAAESLGIDVILGKVKAPGEVPGRIEAMKDQIDLFWMLPDATVINAETVNQLFLFSFQNRVPVFSFSKKYLDHGAVAALIVEPEEIGRQSGELMKKILASPSRRESVLQSPGKPTLAISRKMAAKLRVQISPDIPEGPLDVR